MAASLRLRIGQHVGSGNESVNLLNFRADAGGKEIYTLARLNSYQSAGAHPTFLLQHS